MDAAKPVIRLEREMRPDFLEEIFEIPGGEHIKACIQCGTCSGSCPASPHMEYTPRKVIAMIRAGMRDEVLASNTVWMCASCYMCQVRCPAEIKITDVMYGLKRLAVKEGKAPPKAAFMAEIFIDNINTYGRNSEGLLIMKYYLGTSWIKAMGNTGLGLALFSAGRIGPGDVLSPDRIKNIDQLQRIIKKVEEEGVV